MLPDKAVQEYKEIYKKKIGKEISDAEARDQSQRLVGFFDILFKQAQIEHKRKLRLKGEPNGFHLEEHEGVYNCRICDHPVSGKEAWWDINGVKCLDCQRNIREGAVPGEICQNENLCVKEWQLNYDYNIHPSTRRKLIREGILKPRELKREDGSVYYSVYMVSENKDFFKRCPKKPKMRFEWKTVDSKGREVRP